MSKLWSVSFEVISKIKVTLGVWRLWVFHNETSWCGKVRKGISKNQTSGGPCWLVWDQGSALVKWNLWRLGSTESTINDSEDGQPSARVPRSVSTRTDPWRRSGRFASGKQRVKNRMFTRAPSLPWNYSVMKRRWRRGGRGHHKSMCHWAMRGIRGLTAPPRDNVCIACEMCVLRDSAACDDGMEMRSCRVQSLVLRTTL